MIHAPGWGGTGVVRWRGSRGRAIRRTCAAGCWRRSTAGARPERWRERFRVSASSIDKALGRRNATGETEARPQRNHRALQLAAYREAIAAEVARRSDVTLNELRAWLLATGGVAASLGLMHKTLLRLGLTPKKARPGAGAGPARHRQPTRRLAGRAGPAEPAAARLRR